MSVPTKELKAVVRGIKKRHKPGFYLMTNRDGNLNSEGSLAQAFQRIRKDHLIPAGIPHFQLRDINAKYDTDIEESGRDGAKNVNNSRAIFNANYMRKPKKIEGLKWRAFTHWCVNGF